MISSGNKSNNPQTTIVTIAPRSQSHIFTLFAFFVVMFSPITLYSSQQPPIHAQNSYILLSHCVFFISELSYVTLQPSLYLRNMKNPDLTNHRYCAIV